MLTTGVKRCIFFLQYNLMEGRLVEAKITQILSLRKYSNGGPNSDRMDVCLLSNCMSYVLEEELNGVLSNLFLFRTTNEF